MAFIITASYEDRGNTIDTSNATSLGDHYGHEFATEADAEQVAQELDEGQEAWGLGGITYTVEDIGLTEDEVAGKSADYWWSTMVGQQTPAEFMEHADEDEPVEAALAYLRGVANNEGSFVHTDDAEQDLADKLVEVIDAQA